MNNWPSRLECDAAEIKGLCLAGRSECWKFQLLPIYEEKTTNSNNNKEDQSHCDSKSVIRKPQSITPIKYRCNAIALILYLYTWHLATDGLTDNTDVICSLIISMVQVDINVSEEINRN